MEDLEVYVGAAGYGKTGAFQSYIERRRRLMANGLLEAARLVAMSILQIEEEDPEWSYQNVEGWMR
jgi:hypothetical protein